MMKPVRLNYIELPVSDMAASKSLFSRAFGWKLGESLKAVKTAGATISKDIFSFAVGRRFHFIDPNGNDLAFWQRVGE